MHDNNAFLLGQFLGCKPDENVPTLFAETPTRIHGTQQTSAVRNRYNMSICGVAAMAIIDTGGAGQLEHGFARVVEDTFADSR